MSAKVYFIPCEDNVPDEAMCDKLEAFLVKQGVLDFVDPRDLVAIKTHFGEEGSSGYVRPPILKMIGKLLKEKKSSPFLTETQTLYHGRRTHAVDHMELAMEHGFGFDKTGLPIIMGDGLLGDEETQVQIPGELFQKVGIATLIVKAQALVTVSHFTGHMVSGFGAAIKNLGMGCASRKGKMIQHSTAKPSIRLSKCTGCAECTKWCPKEAISLENQKAKIRRKICIGCGECLAVCRFDAVGYNWSETYEQLQKKMAEHALGVTRTKTGKMIFINFLTRITKDCDCIRKFEKISPDIGILVSTDPVAIDAASLDLVEKRIGNLTQHAYNIPLRVQLEHGKKIGLGETQYDLEG